MKSVHILTKFYQLVSLQNTKIFLNLYVKLYTKHILKEAVK
jgi:hypothetical protein